MNIRFWLSAVVLTVGAMLGAAEPLVVTAQVRDNPTIFLAELPSDPELSKALRSFTGACGWFDLSGRPDSDYVFKCRQTGDKLSFELTLGGVPCGSWQLPRDNRTARQLAAAIVDTIIEKSFRELKVRGFCSSSIAFCAQTAPGVRNLYACDIDGNNVRQLTRLNTLCVEPAWGPTGQTIVYSKYGNSGISVVETMVAPPYRSRLLSAFPGINAGATPSPDGKRLAVILSPDHQVDLYVLDLQTRNRRRLTKGKAVEASPAWSPDGKALAFVSDANGGPRINVINADGTGQKQLPSIGSDAVTPDWSGNNQIVYAARVGGSYTLGFLIKD